MRYLLFSLFFFFISLSLASVFSISYAQYPTPTPEPSVYICGTVFQDANRDGIYNGNDSPLWGRTVNFSTGASTQTDGNGYYCFGPVYPGDYTVSHTPPVGYQATTSTSVAQNFSSNTTVNFGVAIPSTPTFSPNPPSASCSGNNPVASFSYSSSGATWYEIYWNGSGALLYNGASTNFTHTLSPGWSNTPGIQYEVRAFYDNSSGVYSSALSAPVTLADCYYTISGNAYLDSNRSGSWDGSENGYPGATILLNGGNGQTTGSSGQFSYGTLLAGNYTLALTIPSGYVAISPNPATYSIDLQASTTQYFGIAPALYQISGVVFDDQNKDRLKNGAEPNMSGNYQIQVTGPTNQTLTATNGVYSTGATLPEGTYTVSYISAVPPEYNMTYPLNGPPPSFSVTVGRSCTTNGASGASCISAGYTFAASHVQNLNFSMTNYNPWFQCIGGDCRIDSGFSNPIPSTASVACGGPYASISGGGSTQPGILFSGDSSFDFGSGQASPNPYNWQVGGTTAPDAAPYAGSVMRSSTQYLKTTLRQSGVTPTDLSTVCTLNNCTLPANLSSGTYEAAGDVTLNTYTVSANKNFVFIINGDLQINGEILVSAGSTLTISASEDISVSSSIGEVDITSQDPNLEGFYSADGSFIIQGINNCTTGPDRRFNLAGSIVVNAARTGGSLQNQRDLCAGDRSCPAFSVIARPSFLLNVPDFIKYKADVWQEVAP